MFDHADRPGEPRGLFLDDETIEPAFEDRLPDDEGAAERAGGEPHLGLADGSATHSGLADESEPDLGLADGAGTRAGLAHGPDTVLGFLDEPDADLGLSAEPADSSASQRSATSGTVELPRAMDEPPIATDEAAADSDALAPTNHDPGPEPEIGFEDVGVTDDRPGPADPQPDPVRISSAIQRLSEIGGDGRAMVSRLAFTPDERAAHALLAEWLQSAGFSVRVDAFGNTIGERPGGSDLPYLALGSHLDSVPNGGRFDGIVGVVGALEVGRMIQESRIVTRHPLRIVAFANEEGARFGEACLGSKAVAGMLGPRDADRLRDPQGVTLAQAMASVGLDARRIEDARWADGEVAAFLELHIEQARLLEAQELAIGIVDAVAGNTRLRVSLQGRADHSGGTPMDWRQDALAGAAEMVLEVERIANEPARRATVATVGRLNVSPNNITTIPGRVDFSVDVRDVDSDRQRDTMRQLVARCERIAGRRGLTLDYEVVSDTSPSVLPLWLRRLTKQVCVDLGLPHRVMASGAGHDAQILARRLPAGMLFVPSHAGLSHVPEEWTSVEDITRGVRALFACLLRLDRFLADEVA